MSALDSLHDAIDKLEDEGHSLSGHLRTIAEHIKADLFGAGKNEATTLETLVHSLASALSPVLDAAKADTISQTKSLFADALAVAEPVLKTGTTEAHQALSDLVTALKSALGGAPDPATTAPTSPDPAPAADPAAATSTAPEAAATVAP
ncbi:hypothetical protein [Streptomyces sp. NRRL S-350]|uniref:hypothetical protein n=1 Tax=Streptomyces sp. NRRL S-350 TaxID=1463902 RepID=UPI00068DA788|nr:hypothetical protein [Streptomyces sp. NRRL S-350]